VRDNRFLQRPELVGEGGAKALQIAAKILARIRKY
jgi:hypothetical protein